MGSCIDVKPDINCSPGKVLQIGCTTFLKVSFSFRDNSSDSFILLYNLGKESTHFYREPKSMPTHVNLHRYMIHLLPAYPPASRFVPVNDV